MNQVHILTNKLISVRNDQIQRCGILSILKAGSLQSTYGGGWVVVGWNRVGRGGVGCSRTE